MSAVKNTKRFRKIILDHYDLMVLLANLSEMQKQKTDWDVKNLINKIQEQIKKQEMSFKKDLEN